MQEGLKAVLGDGVVEVKLGESWGVMSLSLPLLPVGHVHGEVLTPDPVLHVEPLS